MPWPTTRPCDRCGTPYAYRRLTSRYCTPRCQKAARRAGLDGRKRRFFPRVSA